MTFAYVRTCLRRVDAHHIRSSTPAANDTHRTGPVGNTIAALTHINAMKTWIAAVTHLDRSR